MMNVTLVTRNADADELTPDDYREMFDELKQGHSLSQLVSIIGSQFSRALWNQYERGEKPLSRPMRNELRRAVGLAALPPTVAEATATASPSAAVWQVGDGVPDTVIMVSGEPCTIRVNGAVEVVPQTARVTGVTAGRIERKRYIRPCIPESYSERLQGLTDGLTWLDVIDAGLAALEAQNERV